MNAPTTCHGAACCEFRPLAGWWFCGCAGSLPGHVEVIDVADPVAGGVCAMAWRQCRRCERIEECPALELDYHDLHHLTDTALTGDDLHDGDLTDDEHRAGGFLRQDVPARPGSPDPHDDQPCELRGDNDGRADHQPRGCCRGCAVSRRRKADPMPCVSCGADYDGGCTNSNCGLYPGNCTDCPTCGGVRFKGSCTYDRCASNGGPIDYSGGAA